MAGLIPFNKRNQSLLNSSFQNMLDDFFTESWLPRRNLAHDTFKVDVEETDKEYLVHAELPGIKKDEIGLEIDDGRLIISVNREQSLNEEKKHYIHKERHFMSMSRNIYLTDAKANDIKAKLEHGVLTVTVPKRERLDNLVKIDIE
ncbi:MAG: Hsp20/alpha crystallin family protein [Sporomusa sp.]